MPYNPDPTYPKPNPPPPPPRSIMPNQPLNHTYTAQKEEKLRTAAEGFLADYTKANAYVQLRASEAEELKRQMADVPVEFSFHRGIPTTSFTLYGSVTIHFTSGTAALGYIQCADRNDTTFYQLNQLLAYLLRRYW